MVTLQLLAKLSVISESVSELRAISEFMVALRDIWW